MTKINVGLIFKKMEVLDKILFVPEGICLGKYDKKNDIFYDYLTDSYYGNYVDSIDYDIEKTFGEVTTISEIKSQFQTKSLIVAFRKFLKDSIKSVKMVDILDENINVRDISISKLYIDHDIFLNQDEAINEKRELLRLRREKKDFEAGFEVKKVNSKENKVEEIEGVSIDKISDLCNKIKEEVISQDLPIRKIVIAIYKNIIFDDASMKSNIFIYGPTGVGKTQILKTLSKLLNIPLWIEDMTKYTEAGYKGGDIEQILFNLLANANYDISKAEKSILVLDEIDKKAGSQGDSDVSRSGVLKSLLSIVEGGKFQVPIDEMNSITFDTSKLTIVACGAFTDLLQQFEKTSVPIGFETASSKVVREIQLEDFIKYGMPREFMGRFKSVIKMNSLSIEDFVKILKNSSLSPLNKYIDYLTKIGVNVNFNDQIYQSIASKAYRYKTGARALKIVVDELFEDILYEVFDNLEATNELSLSLAESNEENVALTLKRNSVTNKEKDINA